MATILICDCCGERMHTGLRVTVVEDHPHKGDQLRSDRDVCYRCGERLDLETRGPLLKFIPGEGEVPA